MNKCQEVLGRLLVPRGHPPVLLQLVPEPLDQVPVLGPLPVILPLLLAARERGDHRLRAPGLDRLYQGFAVECLIGDHHRRPHLLEQLLRLAHVGRWARRQEELRGEPEPADGTGDLGREPASAPPQGRIDWAPAAVHFFLAPAAWGWARMTVESRITHSRSGSWRTSKTRRQTPFLAQRSNRRQTLFQLPKYSGRSRHGAPVLEIQRMASMNKRLSLATFPCWPGWPGRRCWIRSQSASLIAWRGGIAGPQGGEKGPVFYPNCPTV